LAEEFATERWFDQRHYNSVAKIIREEFAAWDARYRSIEKFAAFNVLSNIALDFAERFKKECEDFDHLKFLDQCSHNVDLYPLSELWEERHG
jgi:hypothetical protein